VLPPLFRQLRARGRKLSLTLGELPPGRFHVIVAEGRRVEETLFDGAEARDGAQCALTFPIEIANGREGGALGALEHRLEPAATHAAAVLLLLKAAKVLRRWQPERTGHCRQQAAARIAAKVKVGKLIARQLRAGKLHAGKLCIL
jgi:hypothetical protein